MSMQRVAQLAGVSISTVSRVVGAHPNIAPETADAVWAAIDKLKFRPKTRRSLRHLDDGVVARQQEPDSTPTIAFVVFCEPGQRMRPAFERLLHGVSVAAQEQGLRLTFAYSTDTSELPAILEKTPVNGLLLHGAKPTARLQEQLTGKPTVWLMANRQRPEWGDLVMPDNTAIGQLAAKYLCERGHRQLAYLSVPKRGWSLRVRAGAFEDLAEELDANVRSIAVPALNPNESTPNFDAAAIQLADQLFNRADPATGVFASEDQLLPLLDAALNLRSAVTSDEAPVHVISCNNESSTLRNSKTALAEIDLRVEAIGRRGIELLMKRIQKESPEDGRLCMLVEPRLVMQHR